ncbi:hypothetical protein AWM75_03090 [Aerococcus urinaehominis]|uniref:Alanine racemase n=1 Tax=Aerococcus urinaehominis TaxID=128944 RepID=A0A0X8FKL1_9LACT|nr:alanine racemase [Aerococcus urinaehominis]AMB99046.1 hypothetical protein AWM75_03090 [Aerococcus urinaehominis]SDM50556.1 alanine racemase [Aerococcus urinaehominis]
MVAGIHRPSQVDVSLKHIIHNYQTYQNQIGKDKFLYAVVKADAYGHGAVPVSQALAQAGCDGFAVAIADEGLELRQAGIEQPILILGLSQSQDAVLLAEAGLDVTVSQLAWLQAAQPLLAQANFQLKIQLKIDSGMSRIGVRDVASGQDIIDYVTSHKQQFQLTGIFTHFATADSQTPASRAQQSQQAQSFKQLVAGLDLSQLDEAPLIHQSNTAMMTWYPEETLDAGRLGIGLYGVNPSNGELATGLDLKPALTWTSQIVAIKQMAGGEKVSYGATYTCQPGEWLATLPLGYADGLWRAYQGYQVLVAGQAAEIVGRVCMDQAIITLKAPVPIGTPVTLIGPGQSAEAMSRHSHTIGYEVLCAISSRIPRYYR